VQLESSKVIVIFDVDGTINQTEVYAVKAYRKALEEVGKTGFSDKEFIDTVWGIGYRLHKAKE
jgi:phosphoglycolate phosphatase